MSRVLVVNTGSSSIKYQLFEMDPQKVLASGLVERIGEAGSKLTHRAGDAEPLVVEERVADHSDGFDRVFKAFETAGGPITDLAGIGHRVVHGGDRLTAPTLVDDATIQAIADQAPLAPLHNPRQPARHPDRHGQLPRDPAGGRVRHRLPPDDAAPRLPLRPAGRPGRRAAHPPLRLPRHLPCLRHAARRPSTWAARPASSTWSPCTWATGPAWPRSPAAAASTPRWA